MSEQLDRLRQHAAISLYVNKQISSTIDKMLFNFIWKNKTHYVKNSVVMNTYDAGGLNFLDFTTLNNTFKVNWIKQFLNNPTSIWNFIPNFIFSKIGGLKFVLVCDYKIEKLPSNLSQFHKQMLLAWSLIYKHNFSPHRCYIWNNRCVLFKNKSLFFDRWFENSIIYVTQLIDRNGVLLSYSDFLGNFGIPVTPKEYATVMGAIPDAILMLLKGTVRVDNTPLLDPVETMVGSVCLSPKIKNANRGIRALFQNNIISIPSAVSYWSRFVDGLNWKVIWNLPYKYLLTNKVREVSFKLIHRYYPTSHYLLRFKKDICTDCSVCEAHPETVLHLFWNCDHADTFWKDMTRFIIDNIDPDFCLHWQNVLFGFQNNSSKKRNEDFIINLLIILAKFHIHKSKFSHSKPSFLSFEIDAKQYILTICDSKNKKAVKTMQLCTLFNIFV